MRVKSRHILLSTEGKFNHIFKIKPPMVFDRDDANKLVGRTAIAEKKHHRQN
jgi:4-aminobutyrate aminotransferase-like enzyme